MARSEGSESGSEDVVLLVCVKCGREVQHEGGEEPPEGLKCEKCGNEVFRRFDATTTPNEAQEAFRESTDRDTSMEDTAEATTEQDLLDLNNP